jgi:CO/xanthine dehydrogenase FAD-binding subunit
LQDFDYVAANSIDEVVSLLSEAGKPARILSGGTDLLVQLREGRKQAGLVVDIKRISEVNEIVYDPEKGLTLGAAVPCLKICGDPMVSRAYPGLIDGIRLIGGVQIQGRATVGGNLCNASPAGDAIPGLIVHQAQCVVAGPGGTREIPVEQFCTGPGQNTLSAGEFLVAVRVPPPAAGFGAFYLRFIPRHEMDIAVVGAAAGVLLSEDRSSFVSVRISLGAVAPTPLLVSEAGEFLAGKPVTPENILEAARLAQQAARPITDMRGTADQRKHLSLILTKRALQGALERARGQAGGGHNGNGHR